MDSLGAQKQEEKIAYLGIAARELFPQITLEAFERVFRGGVEAALKEHDYAEWRDVVSEPPAVRKKFFESILKGAKHQLLQIGLTDEQVEVLLLKLNKKNRRFLG